MRKHTFKNDYVLPNYLDLFKGVKDKDHIVSKVLWSFLKGNMKNFVISTIFWVIQAAYVWILPIATANIVNIATTPEEHSLWELFLNVIVLLVSILQNRTTYMLYSKYARGAVRSIGLGLRNTLVIKLQQLSLTYHNEMKSGALQSKFLRDTESIEMLINQFTLSLVPCIITVCITACITVSKSLIIAAAFLFIIPLNVAIVRFFNKKIRKYNTDYRQSNESVSSQMTTMMEMIPVTKAHGLEEVEIDKLQESLQKVKSAGLALDYSQADFGTISWMISTGLSVLNLAFSGYLAYIGKISVGEVVMYNTYFTTISGNIQTLLNLYPEFAKGAEAIKSVSEVIISDDIEDNEGKIDLRFVHGTVQFDNVSYAYPHSEGYVIKNLNLNVEPGDCVAFVGGSGSGKTTVMNMIIGFLKATKGEVKIDGKPVDALNMRQYRHFISVVPQNCILFSGTIRDNILYGLKNPSEQKLQEVIDLANLREFVESLPDGLDTMIEEHGSNLSGGQKQRISIARAMMRDPKIIILDEATSALDNISEYQVQKAMSRLIEGRTTFIVAHRLSTIRDANKIIVLEKGECVEMGTFEELMEKKGKFYELKTLSDMTAKELEK